MKHIITIWDVYGPRLLHTEEHLGTREEAIAAAQVLTRQRWSATAVTYAVAVAGLTKREALRAWADLLDAQRVGREAVTRDHEMRREKLYRENKEVFDSLTPEERFEYTIESRQS